MSLVSARKPDQNGLGVAQLATEPPSNAANVPDAPQLPGKHHPRPQRTVAALLCRCCGIPAELAMMPYIYSRGKQTYDTDAPFMRALFMYFPNDPNISNVGDEYRFGPAFLAAPVPGPSIVELTKVVR